MPDFRCFKCDTPLYINGKTIAPFIHRWLKGQRITLCVPCWKEMPDQTMADCLPDKPKERKRKETPKKRKKK